MRDGVALRANIYRPAGAERLPVLLMRTPYGKDLPGASSVLDPVQAARRGYIVIVQDCRGTGVSAGEWEPFRHEAEDGFDTVAWAANLPGADGQVGMYGASYVGFTQWAAASLHPPALRAMVPYITWSDPLDGLIYRGGALELGSGAGWSLAMQIGVLFRRYAAEPQLLGPALAALVADLDALGSEGYRSLPLAEFAPLLRHGATATLIESLAAPMDRTHDAIRPLAVSEQLHGITVPTLNIGGWYDLFLAGTIANYQAMRALGAPSKLLIGPWTHVAQRNPVGELSFGAAAESGLIDLRGDLGSIHLRWFDHWLKGQDTGMLAEPPIACFVMGLNRWRYEQHWPLPEARPTPMYLRAGGQLSTEAPAAEASDTYVYDPDNPVPTRGGATLLTSEFPAGPYDQRDIEARDDVLTFTTPPLDHDTEISGPLVVQLWAASSAPDTDFVARLTDVYPDGRSICLADGIVRARFRDAANGAPPSPIEPGRPYEYTIDLWAISNLFRAGHCIRLQITSSSFPRWDRNQNTVEPIGVSTAMAVATQTIFHDAVHPSRVVLPIVVGNEQ
jgi:putative CocE/NonD family hydrolase